MIKARKDGTQNTIQVSEEDQLHLESAEHQGSEAFQVGYYPKKKESRAQERVLGWR